jgi:predicted nucleic acid-binding protein
VLNGHRIGLCAPVYAELLGGIELSQSREANLKKVFRVRSHFVMWAFDETAAEEYARLFATLTRIGRPMQQIDIQVAAIAIAQGNTTVLTYDSDLSALPALAVENWFQSP